MQFHLLATKPPQSLSKIIENLKKLTVALGSRKIPMMIAVKSRLKVIF